MTDGQWTSVTYSRNGNSRNNKSSFGTRGGRTKPIKSLDELNKNSRNNNKNHNTYTLPSNINYEDENENENDSSDDSLGQDDDTSLLLKPYHIELSMNCPFENCQNELLNDSTKLVDHLIEVHKLRFVNLHHVYLILEDYLGNWGKRINDDNIIQQLKIETDNEGIT